MKVPPGNGSLQPIPNGTIEEEFIIESTLVESDNVGNLVTTQART